MSRRRVLNITSVKKQDNMLAVTANSEGAVSKGPLVISEAAVLCFIPTARKTNTDLTNPAVRNLQSIYGVGYKETVTLDSGTGAVWRWRRIVFNMKGASLRDTIDPPGDTGTAAYNFYDQLPEGGCNRLLAQMTLAQQTALWDFLFRGQQNVDWSGLFLAKVDTIRVSLMRDVTRYVRPTTTVGTSRTTRHWHRIGHNIVYDDDKESNKVGDSAYSTSSKLGWGDMYIVDIIAPAIPNTGMQLRFDVEGTYYFHERA